MKFSKLFFLFFILIVACHQPQKDIFNCNKWNVGDIFHFDVEHIEVELTNDSITNVTKGKYKAELTVLELGETNTLKWTIKEQHRKPDSLLSALDKKISDTIEYKDELTIIYKTNKLGQYQKIINWPDINKYMESKWNDLMKTEKKDFHPNIEFLKKIKKEFLTKPAIEASVTKDIGPLHLIYGLPSSDSLTQTQEKGRGLNYQSLSTKISSKLTQDHDDYAIVRITQLLNPKELKDQVNNMINEYLSDTINSKMDIRDTCLVDYDKLKGWARHIEYWRIISIGNKRKQISVSLKQVEN
ncbi:MAG: hypothetical protein ACXVPU_02835 [Bacteroidia bacterium]